jgi:lysophospholipase L1-like esterase
MIPPMSTRELSLTGGPVAFEGAVSLEVSHAGVKPWRLHFDQHDLYEPGLHGRAENPAGVRITFLGDTRSVALDVEPFPFDRTWTWDLLVDGRLVKRITKPTSDGVIAFDPLPPGRFASGGELKRIEIYMPCDYVPARVRRVTIDASAKAERWTDTRLRWVVYGSSITHAREAFGPSEAWPALVARELDLHLSNLGYGGQEHGEPIVAEMIRDLPADLISICIGGNIWAGGVPTLSERTYRAALIGLIKTIRDRHRATPIALASFIATQHDGESNALGYTTDAYRDWTRDAVTALQQHGDGHIFYVHGPDLFGPHLRHLMDDGVHPGGEGNHVLARSYLEMVMPKLVPPATVRV